MTGSFRSNVRCERHFCERLHCIASIRWRGSTASALATNAGCHRRLRSPSPNVRGFYHYSQLFWAGRETPAAIKLDIRRGELRSTCPTSLPVVDLVPFVSCRSDDFLPLCDINMESCQCVCVEGDGGCSTTAFDCRDPASTCGEKTTSKRSTGLQALDRVSELVESWHKAAYSGTCYACWFSREISTA